MKNLLIIGARGFGREVYSLATECKEYGREFVVKGFLDDKFDALNNYKEYPPIVGSVESYLIEEDDIFICALGNVDAKKKYVQIVLDKGGTFISLIHPTAYISKNTHIGQGCVICRNVMISCDVEIGNFVSLLPFSGIGHDGVVEDWCHIDSHVSCAGFVHLHSMVAVHTGAIIHPKKEVEDNAVVGAGSVVIRNVKKNTTVFGIPAMRLDIH